VEAPAALALPAAGLRRTWHRAPDPLAALVALVLALAGLAAAAVVAASGMMVEWGPFVRFLLLATAMLGLAGWCRYRRLDPRVADAAAFVAAGTLALMTCGLISNVGLRLGAPTIDAYLAVTDAMVGFDVEQAVRTVADFPLAIQTLAWAYNASGVAVVILIAAAVASGRRRAAWELVATVVVAMQVVALVSIAAPAVGAMAHLGLLDLQGAGLPSGAGVYHLDAFARYHAGTDPVVRLSEMSGLVTFPSFHTVLALLATQALAETRWRWIGVAWTAVVIVSTIPIGGHYVTDLAAGFAIWAGCARLARRVSNPSS
jgi:membrane-associated phospholipid phosphatase